MRRRSDCGFVGRRFLIQQVFLKDRMEMKYAFIQNEKKKRNKNLGTEF